MNTTNNNNDDGIDIQEYLSLLAKRKMMIIGITLVMIITSALYNIFVLPPIYRTSSMLMVTQASDKSSNSATQQNNLQDVVNTVSQLPTMTINTYVGQIKTNVILEKVIKALKLDPRYVSPAGLAGMVNVQAIKDSNLIQIDVVSTEPKFAADVANTLGEVFLQHISDNNAQQMAKSVAFLESQIKSEEINYNKAMQKLEQFQSQPRAVEVLKQEMAGKLADITKYQSLLQQMQMEYQQSLAAKASLDSQIANTPEKLSAMNEVYQNLNPAYLELKSNRSTKEVEIAEKKSQIESITTIAGSLQNDIKSLQKELTMKQSRLDLLQNEVERYKNTFNILQEKITQTQVAKSINLGETSLLVTAKALVPKYPFGPNKMRNIFIAAILGLLISFGLAFLLEQLDNTFKKPEDIERILGDSVLGTIPFIKD